ncbi:MAG: FtsX-like permease family protein [Rhodothermales bacterium]|nr:FtsX-like permease family protein [Rhodothermales bacterium]
MNLAILSASYLRKRPATSGLNVLILALGIATIVVLLLVSSQIRDNLTRNSRGIDLVVGAKGSPLQLILSSVYQIDSPTGNIDIDAAEAVMSHRAVKTAIPLALGDSYRGFRLVGSTHDYPAHYGARTAAGRLWETPGEVTLGAVVARQTGLAVGDVFESSHGLDADGETHEDSRLLVTGIFEDTGTVLDRLVMTGIPTVWRIHGIGEASGHEGDASDGAIESEGPPRQYTSLLISYSSPMAAAVFPRFVNTQTDLQAAAPAYETARMFELLGVGFDAIRVFGFILVVTAVLSVFVALLGALKDRRYDLAMMRTLGAPRRKLMTHVLLEGLLLSGMGCLLGLILGHAAAMVLGVALENAQGMALGGFTLLPEEGYVVLFALVAGLAAALIPAWQAYRTDIARILAER